MRFLRLLFWSFLALVVLAFIGRNWKDVTIDLWGNVQADIKLPLLLLIAFLLGYLPTSLRWRLRARQSPPVAARTLPAAVIPAPTFTDDPLP